MLANAIVEFYAIQDIVINIVLWMLAGPIMAWLILKIFRAQYRAIFISIMSLYEESKASWCSQILNDACKNRLKVIIHATILIEGYVQRIDSATVYIDSHDKLRLVAKSNIKMIAISPTDSSKYLGINLSPKQQEKRKLTKVPDLRSKQQIKETRKVFRRDETIT
jgi:sRNA-binding regulator protein Hfq